MPRVNIEEKWWSDIRRSMLIAELGFGLADGVFLLSIRVSQNFSGQSFNATGLLLDQWVTALLKCGLASGTIENLYIKGSLEHHKWLESQRERASKGGQNKAKNSKPLAMAKPEVSNGLATAKPQLSHGLPSYSSSFSKNLNTEETKGTALASVAPSSISSVSVKNSKPPSREVSSLVAAYVKAFQARYGSTVRPDVSPKVVGQMKRLLEYTPLERASALVQVYCQMRDPWFEKKAHDFSTFAENLSKVGLALDRGEESTGINWDKLERELEQDVLL